MQEGWFDEDYFILFSPEEARGASERYRIAEGFPGSTLIGFCGWDDFILRDANGETYAVPTVPALPEYRRPLDVPAADSLEPDARFAGKLKWYVTPIVFGGDPEPGDNLTWVTHDQHAHLVAWWNAKYHEVARASSTSPDDALRG